MTRVRWTRPALQDLEKLQDFIAHDNAAAAYRLTREIIERTTILLSSNQEAGRVGRVSGTRELVLVGTSHIVVYRLREDAEILAVVHTSRNWPDRFDA